MKATEINGVKYVYGDEVQFQVLKDRGYSRGIFRGRFDDERYRIQDIDEAWKMPAGSNHIFTLQPKDFYKPSNI